MAGALGSPAAWPAPNDRPASAGAKTNPIRREIIADARQDIAGRDREHAVALDWWQRSPVPACSHGRLRLACRRSVAAEKAMDRGGRPKKVRGNRPRPGAFAKVSRIARRAALGAEPGGAGLDVYLHAAHVA